MRTPSSASRTRLAGVFQAFGECMIDLRRHPGARGVPTRGEPEAGDAAPDRRPTRLRTVAPPWRHAIGFRGRGASRSAILRVAPERRLEEAMARPIVGIT